jgi:hypothetical protein
MWSDRINFVIPWDRFVAGTSIFIPCLDPSYTLKVFRKESRKHCKNPSAFVIRTVVENGVMGLRVWRT